MRAIVLGLGLAGSLVAGTSLWAAGDQPGRYTMNPAEGGGFARLDTQTGQMSLCQRRDGQWACQDMADQGRGLAEEVERLRQENRLLKGDVQRLEDALKTAGGQIPPGVGAPGRKPGVIDGLPSEQDVDQALSYMQRLFRKFREKMKEFESEGKGTPLDGGAFDRLDKLDLSQAMGRLEVQTRGGDFIDLTQRIRDWLAEAKAGDGLLTLFLRHTSAGLVIQENADPDVQLDLGTALERLAPEDARWQHNSEGPDDMPAHVKAMLTGVNLSIPIIGGRPALGTWQAVYLAEHRAHPHRREVVLHYLGTLA